MRLLDLFCGAGDASAGYARAGFTEIVGIDIEPQKHYPFHFIQADATDPPVRLEDFDLIHASPPCQHWTAYRRRPAVDEGLEDRYEDLLDVTIELLAGYPHVIENLRKAPMRGDLELCGSMFGLDVKRHRWFQLSFPALSPPCNHKLWTVRKYAPSGNRTNKRFTLEVGAWNEPIEKQRRIMGIDWPVMHPQITEMLPPAYTQFIGEQFLSSERNSL